MSASRRKSLPLADYDDEHYTFAAFNVLRHEAMTLLDQALVHGQAPIFIAFVERHMAEMPPPLELINQLADDVHQRLQLLRQTHFDLRDQMITQVRAEFDFDLTPITPPDRLDFYHLINPAAVIDDALANSALDAAQGYALHAVLTELINAAQGLHRDLTLAGDLYDYLVDWLAGLHLDLVRWMWQGHPSRLQ